MTDKQTTIDELKQRFQVFVTQQGWSNLKSPKDLSMDIVSEAAELMDLFLFVDEKNLAQKMNKDREAVRHEVADIAFALLNFCSVFDIDLSQAVEEKLSLLKKKYEEKNARLKKADSK